MHIFKKIIYICAWLLAPVLFLLIFFLKGQICLMYTCGGNNEVGIVYAIGALIAYLATVKTIAYVALDKSFSSLGKSRFGFVYLLVFLVIILSYFLGKSNDKVIYFDPATSSSYETLDGSF